MTNVRCKKGADISQKILIVADDLTGANDTGVQFVKAGLSAAVLFDQSGANPADVKEDVMILDTDTRGASPSEAYKEVSSASHPFAHLESHLFFKKIDSTLRGNIGVEIKALMDLGRFDAAVIAPAFPDARRITVDGVHYVNGLPVHETEAAIDPKTPVAESRIAELLFRQTQILPKAVGIETFRKPDEQVQKDLNSWIDQGHEWFVCDAETNEDLRRIVQVFMNSGQSILWVGAAGLAGALARHVRKRPLQTDRRNEPVMIVSGSASNITNGQLAYLRGQQDPLDVCINPLNVLNGCETREQKRALDQVLAHQGKDVLLYTDAKPETVQRIIAFGRTQGLDRQTVGERLSRFLGAVTTEIVKMTGLKRLVLTGGDTARAICNELGADGIQLLGEIETGIPLGKLLNTDIYAVTKAGAYGQNDSVLSAVEVLRNLEEEDRWQNQSLL
ncbi:four-carbon acid sugar kinase family protein [Bacillus haynesii]|uniref:four-carbon acid sugar kinase family protein n=1 Tax=Bacillus haynesii TaxID=1925021 RepID=UPI00228034BF|nr:four-carbon acid sugar kinase family protein [Bacillus haynesii]MCY8047307.1 four-carbon acid sugar kinase family protein [Bacillus haynesii]MCY8066345.1 four-carbon acid sugar kinase family protein [Bacillus haynesii]MCY8079567.1 four-carbon acid sugar kinase family protein [Bacillus haynesii]MCY8384480.1 four-carbon acid sugar kinase family protein [Bacillus haynesii]MCY8587661.1 four-carbon acid sugar kinase family protein [Bacillus haynesii]